MDTEWTFALVLVVVLLLVVLGSYLVQLKWNWLLDSGGRARGEVVRHNLRLGRVTVVYSVVRFTTSAGVIVEAEYTNGIATAVPGYRIGQQVRVAYDKANPADFIIL